MIKELFISNFQSHYDSTLSFDKGVNVIIGQSDSGKSAIIRALKWLIFNKPSGESFRSNWGGTTKVEIFTDDAHVVRMRDQENKYILGDMHFKAFATDVPSEIIKALNISDINLQQQLDSVFLLSQSAGETAGHFNKIANLSKIDQGTSNVNSAIRALEQDIKYKTAEIEQQEEQLKQFEHLERFEAEVEVLEQEENHLRNMKGSLEGIQDKLYDYHQCEMFIESHQTLLSDEKLVNNLLDLYKQKVQKVEEYEGLRSLLDNYFLISDDIDVAQEEVKDEVTVNTLLDLTGKQKMANEVLSGLSKLLLRYRNMKGLTETEMAHLASLEAKWEEAMPVGSVCPTCNQIIKR
jgi:DNA repair protein SbcC/Rad50